jgi:cell division protein FtsB
MKKLFYSLVLIQGIGLSLYFGAWSIKDYIALEQAVAAQAQHAEMRHRINV